jgi:hypothetical protein
MKKKLIIPMQLNKILSLDQRQTQSVMFLKIDEDVHRIER